MEVIIFLKMKNLKNAIFHISVSGDCMNGHREAQVI